MKCSTFSEVKRFGIDAVEATCPLLVAANGEARFIIARPEDVIVISDWPALMKARARGMAGTVRAGQPNNCDAVITRALAHGMVYDVAGIEKDEDNGNSAEA